jgi:hypothetical protein
MLTHVPKVKRGQKKKKSHPSQQTCTKTNPKNYFQKEHRSLKIQPHGAKTQLTSPKPRFSPKPTVTISITNPEKKPKKSPLIYSSPIATKPQSPTTIDDTSHHPQPLVKPQQPNNPENRNPENPSLEQTHLSLHTKTQTQTHIQTHIQIQIQTHIDERLTCTRRRVTSGQARAPPSPCCGVRNVKRDREDEEEERVSRPGGLGNEGFGWRWCW